MSRQDIKTRCPVCRGCCNCKQCILGQTKDASCKVIYLFNQTVSWQFDNSILLAIFIYWCLCIVLQGSLSDQGNILRIKISNHQFYKLLPVRLNQEQLDELELEAKIQGLIVPILYLELLRFLFVNFLLFIGTKISNVRVQVAENGQNGSFNW
jgi:hypothetical protein